MFKAAGVLQQLVRRYVREFTQNLSKCRNAERSEPPVFTCAALDVVATSEVTVQLHAQSISDFSQLCDSYSVGAERHVIVSSK